MGKRAPSVIPFALAVALTSAWAEQKLETLDLSLDDYVPERTVKQYENRSVEEYRVNDNVYMVKITPRRGQPYYLVDPDGSGQFEWRRHSGGLETDVGVPRWTMLKF